MGCGATLFLATGGHVTCSYGPCPNPTAVSDILAVSETEHIAWLRRDDFTVLHPLRERLSDALAECPVNDYIAELGRPRSTPGKYRVRATPGGWAWDELDE
jgi:Family of unknown function (DUF6085)